MSNEANRHSCSCFECVQMYGLDNTQEELDMNTNEAILKKLIELGAILGNPERGDWLQNIYNDADFRREEFIPLFNAEQFEIVQRALFDECGKQGLFIKICNNTMDVYDCTLTFEEEEENIETIYQGDTSRESFKAAFEKVVGI